MSFFSHDCALRLDRRGVAVALLISWVCAALPQARAQSFPAVNSTNGFSAKRVTGAGFVSGSGVDTFSFTDDQFGMPDEFLFKVDTASAENPSTGVSGRSLYSATSRFGTLRGLATAEANGGQMIAEAKGTAMFIDLMTVLADNQDTRSWSFDLVVDGSLTAPASPGTGASMTSRLWVFDAVGYLNTGFIFSAYQKVTSKNHLGVEQSVVLVDQLELLTPGSLWFVAVEMELQARINHPNTFPPNLPTSTNEARADFSETVNLFIDPDPATPWTSYSFASGHDYHTPVPEPSTLVLAGLGLLVGIAARLSKRTIAAWPIRVVARGGSLARRPRCRPAEPREVAPIRW